MREQETEIGGPGREFRSTLWTVVLKAKEASSPERREALEKLIETYWKPVYFLVRRRGHSPEESKDITQGFFTALLERNFLRHIDRGRGRFRSFIRASLEHYLSDAWDRASAQKRGGGRPPVSLDFGAAETEIAQHGASDDPPDRVFQREWALRVMERALENLRGEFTASGRREEFEALRLHLSLAEREAPSYAHVGKALGLSEDEVRNRLHRARMLFRKAILEVIGSYTECDEDARDELRDLFSAFS